MDKVRKLITGQIGMNLFNGLVTLGNRDAFDLSDFTRGQTFHFFTFGNVTKRWSEQHLYLCSMNDVVPQGLEY